MSIAEKIPSHPRGTFGPAEGPMVRVGIVTPQAAIANATLTDITCWDIAAPNCFDTSADAGYGPMWAAALPSRLVAPIKGLYVATLGLAWAAGAATTTRGASIRLNGGTYFGGSLIPSNPTAAEASLVTGDTGPFLMGAGQYVEARAYQVSGGALAVAVQAGNLGLASYFCLRCVRPMP